LQARGGEDLVQAAGAEAFQVEGDVLEAGRLQRVDHPAAKLRVGEFCKCLQRDLDPRHVALVVTDPQRLKTVLPQETLVAVVADGSNRDDADSTSIIRCAGVDPEINER